MMLMSPKARKRELASFEEERHSAGMLNPNPLRDKTHGMYRGGEG